MPRPRVIDPQGQTRRVVAMVPGQVAADLQREADSRGVTVAQVIREQLQRWHSTSKYHQPRSTST